MKTFPIYVTNKTADGEIMDWRLNAYWAFSLFILFIINATLWLFIGLGAASVILWHHLS